MKAERITITFRIKEIEYGFGAKQESCPDMADVDVIERLARATLQMIKEKSNGS